MLNVDGQTYFANCCQLDCYRQFFSKIWWGAKIHKHKPLVKHKEKTKLFLFSKTTGIQVIFHKLTLEEFFCIVWDSMCYFMLSFMFSNTCLHNKNQMSFLKFKFLFKFMFTLISLITEEAKINVEGVQKLFNVWRKYVRRHHKALFL